MGDRLPPREWLMQNAHFANFYIGIDFTVTNAGSFFSGSLLRHYIGAWVAEGHSMMTTALQIFQ